MNVDPNVGLHIYKNVYLDQWDVHIYVSVDYHKF